MSEPLRKYRVVATLYVLAEDPSEALEIAADALEFWSLHHDEGEVEGHVEVTTA